MNNSMYKLIFGKFGFLGTLTAILLVAFALALIPKATAVHTSAENCVNPPTAPTLNYWPVTYQDQGTPLCHDFPAIDAAVYNSGQALVFSQSEADWQNGLTLASGQEGVALMYIHNGAVNNLGPSATLAKNVKITTRTDTSVGGQHKIEVIFSGDNTNTVRQSYTIHTPSNARLEVVPNSGFMYDYVGNLILDSQNLNLGNSTYTLGDLDACFEYSIFLSFKFKVITDPVVSNTSLAITKQVRSIDKNSTFANSVTVDQNERIQYKVTVKNIGAITANQVVMTDLGVAGVQIEPGSMVLDGLPSVGALPGAIQLGNLSVDQERVITYQAKTLSTSGTYVNTAVASAINANSVQAQSSVIVRTIFTGNPNLSIAKVVKNTNTGSGFSELAQAKTGERVTFRVTVTNTGNTILNNVVLRDSIPSGLQFDDSVVTDGSPSFNVPTLSVNFGSLTVGQSKHLEFATQVLAVGPVQICNLAYVTSDGLAEINDNACVSVVHIPKPGSPNIVLAKSAFNNTKNVDATTVPADRGNYITFTITTTNNGNADAVNYVINDDLSGVLPLAGLIDAPGGNLNGNILSYPAVNIRPGETVTKTFKVWVKTSLASTLSYQIKNTYGNTVIINIPGTIVFEAPKTGTAGTSAVVFAGLLTATAVVVRRGKEILGYIFV